MNLNKSIFVSLLVFSALFIFSCGSKTSVTVDNPTNQIVKLDFENGYTLNLEPYGSKVLQFDEVKSSVKVNGQEAESFEFIKGRKYILNPLKESYFIEAFEYGTTSMGSVLGGQQTKVGGFDLNISQIDDQPVMGYFMETNDLLIERKWDYGLKKSLPEQIEVSSYNTTTTRKKIFRKSAFVSFHKAQGM